MKAFITRGNKKFDIIDELHSDPTYIKVKIGSILPAVDDILVYEGKLGLKDPIIPCGIATAIISEDSVEYGFKRGEKAIINPYISSPNKEETFVETEMYGFEKHGFLRDFAAVPYESLILFPEEIKDDEAIFAHTISLALAVIKNIDLEEGSYIAILGDSVLNLILSQLLKYYRIIPIFISRDERYIKLAKKAGCYFVVNDSKENVYERVFEITGGRLAQSTIFNLNGGISTNYLHMITGYGGDCIITSSSHKSTSRINIDIGGIVQKKLTIKGVADGESDFNAAVNILTQKELNLSDIIDARFPLDEAPMLFSTLSKSPDVYVCPIIKV